MKWRPIETAPRDGTRVLGYGEAAGEISGPAGKLTQEVMSYGSGHSDYPGYDWIITGDGYANWFKPTHWQPLQGDPQ